MDCIQASTNHRELNIRQSLRVKTAEGRNRSYLWWDDASTDDQDIRPVQLPKLLDELGDESLVSCSKGADSNTVHVCIDRLLRNLKRSL